MSVATERKKYAEMSEDFRQLNKQVSRARHNGDLTDDLELRFFRAERDLDEQRKRLTAAKKAENEKGKS